MEPKLVISLIFWTYVEYGLACKTCAVSEWFSWDSCSSTCGQGYRTRQRSLCCPREVPYDTCINELCLGIVAYNDTLMIGKCNMGCLNGGIFDDTCKCLPGWTGKCCELQTITALTECSTCEIGYWGQWNTCSKQCGGGWRSRNKKVCCPDHEDYFTCVNETCKNSISYEEVYEEQPCNINCYNKGVYDGKCQCPPGWKGSCCQNLCENGFYGDGCNATCNCLLNEKCDKVTGACLTEKLITDDDTEFLKMSPADGCNICKSWNQWGTCSHRCGGGIKKRTGYTCCKEDQSSCNTECDNTVGTMVTQNETCNEICENGGRFENGCLCRVGYKGRCCQSECDDGFYGDGCNATCNCLPTQKCDKVSGLCHSDAESNSSNRLYILIGAALGAFALVQIMIIAIVLNYRRKRMATKNSFDKGQFWIQNAPENDYEEIPVRSSGNMKSGNKSFAETPSKLKKSTKKNSLRKDSKKVKCSVNGKTGDMYQYLSQHHPQDVGYQTLLQATTGKALACADQWKQIENEYMDPCMVKPIEDTLNISENTKKCMNQLKPTEIGYMEMGVVKTAENISKYEDHLRPTEIGYMDMGVVKMPENNNIISNSNEAGYQHMSKIYQT